MSNLKVGQFLFPMRQCSLAIVFYNSLKYIYLFAKIGLKKQNKTDYFSRS